MKTTLFTSLSLVSLSFAAPSPGGPNHAIRQTDSRVIARAASRAIIGCEWPVGATKITGIISCCKKADLMDCFEQPFNVNCKKEGWVETCCKKENGAVVKDGRGGKCRKEDDGVRLTF
ncbi:hypothetical protein FPQ18DRAFT_384630 [Pyronema domesticum]|uniref:Uncharacterized protein n=1 Tax=Pyronema omphalodes (strain CBS 100304) TaxID=1076935 RepID=U4LNW6_PYROM|nr:hypothetical protein FPQ18DRAFT_384630 [Pyronema domesticum]CCX16274.1 Protein of unknown function [Pyronema omphalodes CBS 100304]